MDPLSDVLSLLKPRTYVSGGFDLGGDWSIQFPSMRASSAAPSSPAAAGCWSRAFPTQSASSRETASCCHGVGLFA